MKKTILTLALLAFAFGSANAVTVSLHSSNMGIGSMTFGISGNNIMIWETWTSSDQGMLEIRGLDIAANYQVYKYITNNSGDDWDHFANELLDPSGDNTDELYDLPNEAWVPTGFSHSTEYDGLSYAQGSGLPRTSNHFSDRTDDELGGRDYIDFFDGLIANGGTDTMSFGLRDNGASVNQPFILAQRPNTYTGEEPVIPEPTTMLLFGLGLAGVAIRNRFKK